MAKPVLVAYATRRGSTREVAADVARVLRQSGLEVELEPAREVKKLDRYGAVVLGGALYMGRLHKDARKFLKRHRRQLSGLLLAVFAMGPKSTEAAELAGASAQLARALGAIPELKPFSTAIFGGVIDPNKLGFPFSKMQAIDARDWKAIQAWAGEIAGRISTAPTS